MSHEHGGKFLISRADHVPFQMIASAMDQDSRRPCNALNQAYQVRKLGQATYVLDRDVRVWPYLVSS
jgi:hypothetical protein